MMHEHHTVVLEDGIVGLISRSSIGYKFIRSFIGEVVTVKFYDEKGIIQYRKGKMIDVLWVAFNDQ